MAAAAAKASKLEDARIPIFDDKKYDAWLELVRATCMLNTDASHVLSKGSKDPATLFAKFYPAEYGLLAADDKPSEEDVRKEPVEKLNTFLNKVLDQPGPVPAADGAAATPGISLEIKLKLQKDVRQWIAGEQAIYAILTKSLVHEPKLKSEPEGAGRQQLEDLKTYWEKSGTKTTTALVLAGRLWSAEKGTSLKVYLRSLKDYFKECDKAKPDPITYNKQQKLDIYVAGLQRQNMFLKEIDDGIKDDYDNIDVISNGF